MIKKTFGSDYPTKTTLTYVLLRCDSCNPGLPDISIQVGPTVRYAYKYTEDSNFNR